MQIEVLPVIGAAGATYDAHVPVLVEPDATQLELAPLSVKLYNVPFLLLPLRSFNVVTAVLLPPAIPWLKL